MLTVDAIIKDAGGPARIAEASCEHSPVGEGITTSSAVRYWRASGIPSRWYRLVSELSGHSIAEVHEANERLWRSSSLARAS